jgi:hypothetical protein
MLTGDKNYAGLSSASGVNRMILNQLIILIKG